MNLYNTFLNNLDSIEDVVLDVINAKEDLVSGNFTELNTIYNCQYGSDGFCGKSQEIFKFYKTSIINVQGVVDIFQHFLNTSILVIFLN